MHRVDFFPKTISAQWSAIKECRVDFKPSDSPAFFGEFSTFPLSQKVRRVPGELSCTLHDFGAESSPENTPTYSPIRIHFFQI